MPSNLKSSLRVALAAVALLGLAAVSVHACDKPAASPRALPLVGSFFDTCRVSTDIDNHGLPGVHIDIASAGRVSVMRGPVICLTNSQVNNLIPEVAGNPFDPTSGLSLVFGQEPHVLTILPYQGWGSYVLRDECGDTLTMDFLLIADAPGAHPIMFHGTLTVTGGTGRYAGATGSADATGWAEFDPGSQSETKGGWEFSGKIVLPANTYCPDGK
jgi:hypothetical protein